jgi:hypothetical protein
VSGLLRPVTPAAFPITIPTHPHLKLGRQHRSFKPMLSFSQIKSLLLRARLVSPVGFDYSTGLPDDLGVMFNDTYGDCAFAAKYHRYQAVIFRLTGQFIPGASLQDLALLLYGLVTGFKANDPSTDQGGNMQTIASYLVAKGMPLPAGVVDQFTAAFEIDPTNLTDLSICGEQCLGVDLGIQVTTAVMPPDGSDPPLIWDDVPGATVLGGHGIYALARDPATGNFKANSWGRWYWLTPAFLRKNLMEANAYVSDDSLKDGKSVLGLDKAAWLSVMSGHATTVH